MLEFTVTLDRDIEELRGAILVQYGVLRRLCMAKAAYLGVEVPSPDDVIRGTAKWSDDVKPTFSAKQARTFERKSSVRRRGRVVKNRFDENVAARVRELRARNLTFQAIADEVGISRGSVGNILNKRGGYAHV